MSITDLYCRKKFKFLKLYEPYHEKTKVLHMQKERSRHHQLRSNEISNVKPISTFVFATKKVHFLYFINRKFLASSRTSPLNCVKTVRKPHCWPSHVVVHYVVKGVKICFQYTLLMSYFLFIFFFFILFHFISSPFLLFNHILTKLCICICALNEQTN